MRSVRLDAATEQKLKTAAELSGQPISEIIREAVREKCARIIGERLDVALGDYIGAISHGGTSRDTGRQFAELLEERQKRNRRKKKKSS